MPFPKIHSCVMCEGVRPEENGKSTIVGFLGITPYVEIAVQDLSKKVQRLTFLFLGMGGLGKFKLICRVVRLSGKDAGKVLESSSEGLVEFKDKEKGVAFVLEIPPISFDYEGEYNLQLVVDGQD